jgi:isopenicillin-N N-acyltransferase-like protein
MLMHAVPGELGGTGLNGHGVCVFANTLWSQSGRAWMAPPVLRRAILECATADEAVTRVRGMEGPAVGNYLVIDRLGSIRNLEVLPQRLAVHAQDSGVYAHANHCLDERLKPYEKTPSPSPGSEGRRSCLQRALEREAGELAVEPLTRMLADHSGSPEAVCRHALGPKDLETSAALIAEPEDGRLHISYGPPCEGNFALYSLPVTIA